MATKRIQEYKESIPGRCLVCELCHMDSHPGRECKYAGFTKKDVENMRIKDEKLDRLSPAAKFYIAHMEQEDKAIQAIMKLDPNTSKKGKLPVGQLHPQFLRSLATVLEVSKEKGYEVNNWSKDTFKGKYAEYLVSAAMRHIVEFLDGHDYNEEKTLDGNAIELKSLHVENAAYNLLMVATLFRNGRTDLDDREKK